MKSPAIFDRFWRRLVAEDRGRVRRAAAFALLLVATSGLPLRTGATELHGADETAPAASIVDTCLAALDGNPDAQYRLARRYLAGRGVVRDNTIGATLLALAARQGHGGARMLLGGVETSHKLPDCRRIALRAGDARLTDAERDRNGRLEQHLAALPDARRRHADLVRRLAPRFAVDPRLALAIVRTESNFDPRARSPKNALGLMQLIPATAARFGVDDPLDPEQNVRGGLAYLRWLLVRYDGDVRLAAAAYNAGEGAVDRHGGVPPYDETRAYVRRVVELYRGAIHRVPAPLTNRGVMPVPAG